MPNKQALQVCGPSSGGERGVISEEEKGEQLNGGTKELEVGSQPAV